MSHLSTTSWLPLALTIGVIACDSPPKETAAPRATSEPSAVAPEPAKTSAPTATAAATKPSHPCPEGSEGEGTLDKPCAAKGAARIMDVTWTGKITDKGPSFRVTNKAKLEILYGNVFVYFYDKAGKQLEVTVADKKRPKVSCGGNIFAGPMKAGEKATLWFSCVKKDHVPEGTAAIEAEMKTVGFTAKEGHRSDTFWQNDDLVPDERPKGGIK
jgi:hypothetical protein